MTDVDGDSDEDDDDDGGAAEHKSEGPVCNSSRYAINLTDEAVLASASEATTLLDSPPSRPTVQASSNRDYKAH